MAFLKKNKIFFAIIIGAVIIGGFVYLGLKDNKVEIASSQAPRNNGESGTPPVKEAKAIASAGCLAKENSFATKVIDGDTIVVEGGYHVRLLGMDADEKGYPCYEPAKTRLENLILGKQITLEKDVSDTDQYGRCLRYIFLGSGNIDVQLVKEGLAVARFYEPDVKYKTEISQAEKEAIAGKIGCKWSQN